jgi:hypothetical protein
MAGTVAVRCHLCLGEYTGDRNLRKHLHRVHQADLPMQCEYCPRRFLNRRSLDTHNGFCHHEFVTNARNKPEVQRAWNLMTNYGMTIADFDRLLEEQGGHCACCPATVSDASGRVLHVDHDHASGRVRGLLCSACNRALGNVRDDPARLRLLASYLESGGHRG